jgi:hypothetical protein
MKDIENVRAVEFWMMLICRMTRDGSCYTDETSTGIGMTCRLLRQYDSFSEDIGFTVSYLLRRDTNSMLFANYSGWLFRETTFSG